MSAVNTNRPREPVLENDESFMACCLALEQCSKDPVVQVGACVVDSEGNLVGAGYNDMSPRFMNSDRFWAKDNVPGYLKKRFHVRHAEWNAILNSNNANLKGGTLYSTLKPCNECAKVILQRGIAKVVYLRTKEGEEFDAADEMFRGADKPEIVCEQFQTEIRTVEFSFEKNIRRQKPCVKSYNE